MTLATSPIAIEPLFLDVRNAVLHVTPEQFDELCIHNPDLRLELTKDGELIVMPPTGFDTGEKNSGLTAQVRLWNERTKLGRTADSSTLYDFTSIGGGKMSPDVSWVGESRLVGIDTTKFIAVVPDFVIELRSPSDNLKPLQTKMLEYQRLGVRLGLLLNPPKQQVEIYRPGKPMELLESPRSIDCDEVLFGFTLNLDRAGIWPDLKPSVEIVPTVEQLSRDEWQKEIVLRQLNRKFGDLTPQNKARIAVLPSERRTELIDALLDFANQQDLEAWLVGSSPNH
jgi:Uma2 family endonuclease